VVSEISSPVACVLSWRQLSFGLANCLRGDCWQRRCYGAIDLPIWLPLLLLLLHRSPGGSMPAYARGRRSPWCSGNKRAEWEYEQNPAVASRVKLLTQYARVVCARLSVGLWARDGWITIVKCDVDELPIWLAHNSLRLSSRDLPSFANICFEVVQSAVQTISHSIANTAYCCSVYTLNPCCLIQQTI